MLSFLTASVTIASVTIASVTIASVTVNRLEKRNKHRYKMFSLHQWKDDIAAAVPVRTTHVGLVGVVPAVVVAVAVVDALDTSSVQTEELVILTHHRRCNTVNTVSNTHQVVTITYTHTHTHRQTDTHTHTHTPPALQHSQYRQ